MPNLSRRHESDATFRLMVATSWLAPEPYRQQQEDAIREAISAGADWQKYLSFVTERHRTPALSWAALKRVPGLEIPEPAKRKLQQADRLCRTQALRHVMVLSEMLKDFHTAGIPVISLKGPLLSQELYGDAMIRQSKDLDILVAQHDFHRARTLLESLGRQPLLDVSALTPRRTSFFLQSECHLEFIHEQHGYCVELHWRIRGDGAEEMAERWSRSLPSTWQGSPFRNLDPIDLTLYLCDHGSEHIWFRAKWLGDLARMHAIEFVDWQAAFQRAHAMGRERSLLLCLRLLEELYGLPQPAWTQEPAKSLPPYLLSHSMRRVRQEEEPETHLTRIKEMRFNQLLRPSKAWRQTIAELVYSRTDLVSLRLPDSFFWAYLPLRPVLWTWRLLQRTFQSVKANSTASSETAKRKS